MFTDARVHRAMARFVPAAEELSHGRSVKGVEGDLFRRITAKGHTVFGGPTGQGLYAATADGELLASLHPVQPVADPALVASMLEEALARWDALPPGRIPAGEPEGRPPSYLREDAGFPEGGAALQVFSRDLPRASGSASDWRAGAWNLDHLWLRPEEVASMTKGVIPPHVALRLARFHLLDNVRGLVARFALADVKRARLTSAADRGSIRLHGEFASHARGVWSVDGEVTKGPQERGMVGTLLGRASVDPGTARLTACEAVFLGIRWGGDIYNGRADDLGPNPIGFAIVLTEDPLARQVTPAFVQSYFKHIDYWSGRSTW